MLKACIIGASGYTGAELARLLTLHPNFELAGLFVSQNSQDANKPLSQLHPTLSGLVDAKVSAINDDLLIELAQSMDAIFLATPHEASHDWMPKLVNGNAKVFDLSGAFRIKDTGVFADYYGFEHQHNSLLEEAIYGLAEWNAAQIQQANLVAVPGCYPTASLSALKPLIDNNLINPQHRPIINAVSGVSGAGRKAALTNSYCEVSLQAYGVLGHRHQPEISQSLGSEVIFTPHLGNFKRGILATITVKVADGTSQSQIDDAYQQAYKDKPIVRLLNHFPKLDDVVNTAHCDLHWKYDANSGYLVIGSAIDNLLKGAASQAIQCANLAFGYASHTSLIYEAGKCR
ncbi:N-acetyl-gamma-glutamyl-phosphate reductase [Aliiglaciecola lipolytica]|uniref:N-acetyl-gamma-glutamyl-phosphate reductase n=1 Tax=Aliiglaciecola lipolytica E3 TaxID=1127673 RepID=K6YCZ8_9ALTE|nr:N-acetyl-gamma-glutamyl-phosphate reductase [Aliiglaciecola lipolytica]GAC16077.1 N-acetyl-gamma-glutamyl-phosphate/N-acetyl-gamma-aminoadipyl-phosphate reductase [Aliiglaciecola lipolytica E3]